MTMRSDCLLLGMKFADISETEAARLVSERKQGDDFAYVVTPNADHLVRLSRNPDLSAIYDDAWLRLLDSRVVAKAARMLGLRTPSVAAGSDVTRLLLTEHLRAGDRVTIIGLEPRLLPALVKRCNLVQPAHLYPPIGFECDPAELAKVVAFVLANPARFIFLAVGSPRQELLCEALAATGSATGTALCIGASLEFLTGSTPRAPRWMQLLGLEWLHRLSRNPRRLARRYFVNSPPVFLLLLKEAARSRAAERSNLAGSQRTPSPKS